VSVLAMGFFSPIVLFTYDLWLALLIITQFDPSMSWSDVRTTSRREFARYWPMLLCHLAVVPFVLRMSSLMGESTSFAPGPTAVVAGLARMHSTLWIFAVAFGAGLILHYRRFRAGEPGRTRWLVWSAPFGLLLYPLIKLPGGNEYKILLLWSLPLSLAIVLAANELVRERGRALRLATLVVLLACGSGSILANAWVRTHDRLAKTDPWVFRGVSTEWKGRAPATEPSQQLVNWIQANTAVTDFLLVASQGWDRSNIPLLTQRRIVAARPSRHTVRLPNHPRLLELNRRLLSRIQEEKRWVANAGDPLTAGLYEIVGDEQELFAVVRKAESGRWPSHPSLAYQSRRYAILTPVPGLPAATAGPGDQAPVEIHQPGVEP
jgi:hypothetical protein